MRITCTSADDRGIHTQHLSLTLNPDIYITQVAASRTFTVYEDHCDAPELTVVPIRLTALDKGTDYRPVVADEADSARIFKRIMKLSSGMGDFVNGELTAS